MGSIDCFDGCRASSVRASRAQLGDEPAVCGTEDGVGAVIAKSGRLGSSSPHPSGRMATRRRARRSARATCSGRLPHPSPARTSACFVCRSATRQVRGEMTPWSGDRSPCARTARFESRLPPGPWSPFHGRAQARASRSRWGACGWARGRASRGQARCPRGRHAERRRAVQHLLGHRRETWVSMRRSTDGKCLVKALHSSSSASSGKRASRHSDTAGSMPITMPDARRRSASVSPSTRRAAPRSDCPWGVSLATFVLRSQIGTPRLFSRFAIDVLIAD